MYLKARLAIFCLFLVHGLIVSTWASRLPLIQANLGVSSGQLGLLLLSSAIGSLLSMPATSKVMGAFGSKRIGALSAVVFCLTLPCLALSPSPFWLAVALFCYGFAGGAMDISMNAQAVHLEKSYQKSIMVAFHAFFSMGGMLGAVGGSVMASHGISPDLHFLGASLLFMASVGTAAFFLLPDTTKQTEKSPLFAPFSWPLAGLCVIGFSCFLSEGAIIDWSGIYLYRALKTTESLAALGYAFFSIAMTFGRLIGDSLTERFGAGNLVWLGCLFAGGGMAYVLFSTGAFHALAGFSLVGLGFSVVVPLVFSASGRIGGNSRANLTTITLFSYSAFLLGPPLMGLLAEWFNLRIALALVIVLTLISALFAKTAFRTVGLTQPEIPIND